MTRKLATAKHPGNSQDFGVSGANPGSKAIPLRRLWSDAITRTDAHARACNRCFQRSMTAAQARTMGLLGSAAFDPAPPCEKALALWGDERTAMLAYLAAGGTLPAQEPKRRIV